MKTVRLQMAPFRIPFYQLAILESGDGKVGSDGKDVNLDELTLFFQLPGQIIYWDVQQNWRGYYVSVEESFYTVQMDSFRKLFDLPYFQSYTPGIRLQKSEAELITDVMQKMDEEYSHPTPYDKPIIKSYLNSLLALCIRFFDRHTKDSMLNRQASSLSERFKQTVHHKVSALVLNLSDQSIGVSEVADELAITAKHLSETIKKDLGVTPTDYINQSLVDEAQKLLTTTDLQVKEIAYQLGFNDASYFNRLFKKVSGLSPAKYRSNQ